MNNSLSNKVILAATASQANEKFIIHLRSTLQVQPVSAFTLSRESVKWRARSVEVMGEEGVAKLEEEIENCRANLRKDYGILSYLVYKYLCKDIKLSSLLADSGPRFPTFGVLLTHSQLLQLQQLPPKLQPSLQNNEALDVLSPQISQKLTMEDKPDEDETSNSASDMDSSTNAINPEGDLDFDDGYHLTETTNNTTSNEPLAFSGYYQINGIDVCDSSSQVKTSDLPPSEELDQFDMTPVVPWIDEHPKPGDVDEETFIAYYKQLVAFVYCATGDERKETARACFAPNVIPSDDQFKNVYFVIDEIKEKIANAVGLPVLINMLRGKDLQELAKGEVFNNMSSRVKFFRTEFWNNPTGLLQLVHEINPALDMEFIFSNNVYEDHLSYLNKHRYILRKHLCTRISLLMDLVFVGQIHQGSDDSDGYGKNTEWVKERISKRLKPHPATEKKFGELKLNDWPIKSPIDPKNNEAPWETWYRASRTDSTES